MPLDVDSPLALEPLPAHPSPTLDGSFMLYVFSDGQLYGLNNSVPGPGGASSGGVPGKVWGDTFRPPLLFFDTVATSTQAPTAADLNISNFVIGDVIVREADFEMFEYEQTGQFSQGIVDLGVKWASSIQNGLPVGGATGQVLAKKSATNYDTQWVAQTGGGSTGGGASLSVQGSLTMPNGALGNESKLPIGTVNYDTQIWWDATNLRYTPKASGYYQVNGSFSGTVAQAVNNIVDLVISKNGLSVAIQRQEAAYASVGPVLTVSYLVYCNGSTDYIELWGNSSSAGMTGTASLTVVRVDGPGGGGNAVTPTTAGRAWCHTAVPFVANTWTKIPVDTVPAGGDPGNHIDVTNHRYIAPSNGVYQVNGNVVFNVTTNGFFAAAIYLNGAQDTAGAGVDSNATLGQEVAASVSALVTCKAGDAIELWAFSSTGSNNIFQSSSNNVLSVVQVDQPTPVATNTGARAYRNAAFSLTPGTFAKVPLDTIGFDPGGHYNVAGADGIATKGRYTVTAAGLYQVTGVIEANAPNANQRNIAAIYKNGIAVAWGGQAAPTAAAGGTMGSAVSDVVSCNPGDYLELWGYCLAGTAAALGDLGPTNNYMSVVKVDQPLYANNPSVVTALPATPFDGQEIYFVADAANGVKWHLRYNAGSSSTHKWEFLGGPSMISRVDTDEVYTNTTAYAAAPTADRLTFPVAGDYEYDMTVEHYQTSGATQTSVGLSINGAAPAVADIMQQVGGPSGQTITKPGNLLNMTAAQTVAMFYNNTTGGGVTHVRYRVLRLRPVRLG